MENHKKIYKFSKQIFFSNLGKKNHEINESPKMRKSQKIKLKRPYLEKTLVFEISLPQLTKKIVFFFIHFNINITLFYFRYYCQG